MRRVAPLISVLCVIGLTSCGGHQTVNVTKAATEAALGTTIVLTVGDTLDLALAENPTTGYQWHCSWTPTAALQLTQDQYVPDQPVGIGSGGKHHFMLKALQAGQVTVTVQLGQWWPGGQRDPAETLTLMAVF